MKHRFAGRYQFLRRLGSGGMGVVYLAYDVTTRSQCAVKRLPARAVEGGAAALRREFEALARLRHPAIVGVREFAVTPEGEPYLVLEFVPGLSADAVVARGDWRRVAEVGIEMAHGLEALHAAGVVHGDLKPTNVIVVADTDPAARFASVRLLDFGLAALLGGAGETHRGTAGYAAPEMVLGEPPTPASDLYGLGATMCALLLGEPPFPGADAAARLRAQREGPPERHRLEGFGAPEPFLDLVLALLAPSASDRPESARAARLEIERVVPGSRRDLGERFGAAVVVGRDRDLVRLEARLALAPRAPRLALVRGEAGVGKTAFLGALVARAILAGRATLSLSCQASSERGAVARAVARLLYDRVPAEKRASADAGVALLDPAAPLDDAALEPAVHATMRWAGAALDVRGLLVTLDDAEALDPWSGAWLRRLLLQAKPPAIRWVLAARGEAATEADVLLDAGRGIGVTLDVLAPAEVEALVGARLHAPPPRELLEFLARHAAGHPGFTVELLRAAARAGAIVETEAGITVHAARLSEVGGAGDFEQRLLERLDALDPSGRATVDALALAGEALAPEALRALEPRADDALPSLVANGLVTRAASGVLLLRGATVAEWLRERIAPDRAAALHRVRLEAPGIAATHRVRHALALGETALALEAAEAAFALDPDGPLALTAAAAARSADASLAARWYVRAAQSFRARGRYDKVRDPIEHALALDPAAPSRASLWVLLSTSALRVGDLEGVLDVVRRAESEALPASAHAQLLVNRASALQSLGRGDAGSVDSNRAMGLAEESKDPVAIGLASERLSYEHLERGALDAAERLQRRMAEAYLSIRDPFGMAAALSLESRIAQSRGRTDEAERLLVEAIGLVRTTPNRLALGTRLRQLGELRVNTGRWGAADEPELEALRIALEDRFDTEAAILSGHLAVSDGLRGRGRRARRRARAALRLSARAAPGNLGYARRALAQAERVLGRRAAALRAASRALADPTPAWPEERQWEWLELGRAQFAREAWGDAREAFERARPEGAVLGPTIVAIARVFSSRVRLRQRDALGARAELDAARAVLEHVRSPYAEAFALLAEAEIAFADNRPAAAFENGRLAMAAFESLPAPWERARAALDLAKLAPNVPGLSEAVVEWLESAARGFERVGDRRSRVEALARSLEWLRRSGQPSASARDTGLLERVSWLLHSLTDLGELLRRSMRAVVEQLDAERGVLLLVDRDTGQLEPMAEFGAVEAAMRSEATTYSRQIVRDVAHTGGSLLITDAPSDPRAASESIASLRLRSILAVPMFLGGRTVGAVYLDDSRRAHAFGESDRGLLEGFAQLMAVAIEKSRGHEEVRRENEMLEGENRSLRAEINARVRVKGVIGTSDAMQKVLSLVEHAARTNATVLITGEMGTGKDLIARTLHHQGKRRRGPFVYVNCGAIPEALLESELFGILSNVATGVTARVGKFVQADGGTLFLDEIGTMPPKQQVALLAAISNREITPVGGQRPIAVDVRIIAATNSDLRQLVDRGLFRQDLFYRLNVIEIALPPLRERKGDVPALVEHFVRHFEKQQDRENLVLSPDFLAVMMHSDWPGNVRELQNYIERTIAMSPGEVLRPEPPPRDLEQRSSSLRFDAKRRLLEALSEVERRMIQRALDHADGNQSRAARELGIAEQTLRYRMKKLGIGTSREKRRIRNKLRI